MNSRRSSFDHLVGSGEQLRGNFEAKALSFEVECKEQVVWNLDGTESLGAPL